MAQLIEEANALNKTGEDIFGVPIHKVHNNIRRILTIAEPIPAWLYGSYDLPHLPRYNKFVQSNVIMKTTGFGITKVSEHMIFIIENLSGEWRLTKRGFLFADDSDLIHYRLRWT